MAITYVQDGNIFASEAQCLINPVNCVGVMGAGLALSFKTKYRKMFHIYQTICENKTLRIGTVGFWRDKHTTDKIVCLFPTKDHWRDKSKLEYIDKSLQAFIRVAPEYKITTVAFPMVGCGKGGLDFERHVRPLLEMRFKDTKFDVEVYV